MLEGGIKCKFLGLGTEQLVKKVVSPAVKENGTPCIDAKTGKQLTKTTYEPLACLVYNKADNNYTLTVAEEEDNDSEDLVESVPEAEQPTEESNDNPFNF